MAPESMREWGCKVPMSEEVVELVTREWAHYGLPDSGKISLEVSMGRQSHRASGVSEETDRVDRVVLPALRDAVAAFPEVERILLFGSRAKGDAEPRSDIDIAVSCPTASKRTWLEICRVAEEAETLLKIDVVRLEEAGPDFRERIDREGKVLYERR